MSQPVQESYSPRPMSASGLLIGSNGGTIGGFLCTVTGEITLSYGADGSGAVIVGAVPVTAGVFLPMPFTFPPGVFVYAAMTTAEGTFAVL